MKNVGLAFALIVIGIVSVEADSTIDPTNHQAWAANIGFTDWRPSASDGVNLGQNFCAGFIYAANVGWIKMGTDAPADGISYSNTSTADFGVNCSAGAVGEKILRGFAYGANIGWVNFEETGNPRVILATGRLRGFVWSANCGWINLDYANVFVRTAPETSPTPSPTPTATATATPAASATATPNATGTPTPPATPTASPNPTATPNPSATATPGATAMPHSHLANISTRMRVEAGDNVLIAGLIVQGTENKRIIIRGIGPSLAAFGIADPLLDPTLELNSNDAGLVASNNNWAQNMNAGEIITTGLAPQNVAESALLLSVAPGSYTAVLRGNGGSTGIGLIEVYDLDTNGAASVVNISTRGFVLAGENVMIGGLIVTGDAPAPLVLRGIGPSLGDFGVPDPLADPLLELRDGNGALIQTNNDWRGTQEVALQNTGLAPTNDQESAILISVPPGTYTAILKGADGGVGNGLLEVYQLSP